MKPVSEQLLEVAEAFNAAVAASTIGNSLTADTVRSILAQLVGQALLQERAK